MRRQLSYFLIGSSISVLLIGSITLAQRQPTRVASAAGQATQFLYLPLITRSCIGSQLIQDSGFEATHPDKTNPLWITNSNKGSSILDDTSTIPFPNPTHSGAWKAWLSGSDNAQESLWQTFTVPTGVAGLQVSYWYRLATNEPPSNPPNSDKLFVQIRDVNAQVLETNTSWNLYNGDTLPVWAYKSFTLNQSHAGQVIRIYFNATTDGTYATSFFIDDVSVTCQ